MGEGNCHYSGMPRARINVGIVIVTFTPLTLSDYMVA